MKRKVAGRILITCFLLCAMLLPFGGQVATAADTPDILNLSLREMRQLLDKGELTSVQIVEFYLERIAAYDKEGPNLNTIRALNMDILNHADAMDRELKAGRSRGPLHGIPVLLKDNIDAVGFPTTAGSLALEHHYPTVDSPLVANLRQAGAIILGKANMTEWANFISTAMVNGYSSLGGYVLNPYGPGVFDVSGSSSGSAAAVAAGLVPVAVGTETSGSIVSPSNMNSVFGLKPSIGLVSRSGIVPISPSQDTAGPIAKNVEDLAVMLTIMQSVDANDPATFGTAPFQKDYTTFLNKDALKGVRIGVAIQDVNRLLENPANQERIDLFNKTLSELTSLGATIVNVEMPGYSKRFEYSSRVLWYEFKPALNAYLKNTSSNVPVGSLADVIVFNAQDPLNRARYNQAIMEDAEKLSGSLNESEYIQHRMWDRLYNRELGTDYAIKEYNVSAVLYPGNGGFIVARAGYPSLNMPIGYLSDGTPYGMTLTGTAFTEGTLISYAYAYEQAFPHRVWPTLD